ncbi:Gfo/Idh/MocA family oxidoreductase [Mesorhizobium sp. LHD-90]|uniref:Gfo/Idh/MocA family protein n=1 Tax=Mesorhizobium sp. LHD-90 TaxID=3071414 RepID=UPI0027E1D8EC|nr:Gfo/Idh/MocA family oxidoreductase [Mesorhizobium sp. LHD-90]MDQ6435372.1 Gfo/Idh/MocA family oxidoreductase [Mesorhizobium sp. LHD-90]
MTIRVGVVGCGFYAQNHLNSWEELKSSGAVLAAVCDVDPAKAEAAGRNFGVPFYTDAAGMFDAEKLDLVDIVTRHETHRALCELSIGRGIATIVQKPFAPSWGDCVAIVDAAAKAGIWLAVHENFRFQTPMRHVRRVIDSGAIGQPTWARINFRTGYDVYRTQPYFYDEERLAIADVGIHVLDLARYFVGEVRHLSCETQRRNPKVRAEETATMMLRHENDAVSVVECTYGSRKLPDPFPETLLEIEGENGAIVVNIGLRMSVTSGGQVLEESIGSPLRAWTSEPWHASQEGAFNACQHFLDCLKRGVPADTSGEDNLKTFALVEAAYKAAEEKRAVEPETWRRKG